MREKKLIMQFNKFWLLFIFLNSTYTIYSQNTKYYPEFNNYGSWSIGGSYYFFQKETINKLAGVYQHKPLYSSGYLYTIRKMFNKTGRFSYITGLTLNNNNLYKFEYSLKQYDLNSLDYYEDFESIISGNLTRRINFSVPILVQYKFKINPNLFMKFDTGIETMYMAAGYSDYSSNFYDNEGNGKNLIYYWLENNHKTPLYPSIVFSPGIYIMTRYFMIQTSIVYNKSLKNQYKGEMRFMNLDISDDSVIETKKSGDYLGISLQIFLAK